MPRIDPLQLLNCLKVLLSPTGGINSSKEVSRLASLMRKFSKKLVSKCIYIQILKASQVELLDKFLNTGGWELIYCWLVDGYSNENWPLIKELLDLLEICPTTADMKDCSNLFKSGSSDTNVPEDIQQKAQIIEKKWEAWTAATVDNAANKKSEEKADGASTQDHETSDDKEDGNSPDQGNDIYKVDKVYMKGGKQVIKLRKKDAAEAALKTAAKKRGRPKKVTAGDGPLKRKRRKIKNVVEEEEVSDEEDFALKQRRRSNRVKSKKCIESSDESEDEDDQKAPTPSTDKDSEDSKSSTADSAKPEPGKPASKSLDKEAITDMLADNNVRPKENDSSAKQKENDGHAKPKESGKKSEVAKKEVKSESEKTSKGSERKHSVDKDKKTKHSTKSGDHKKEHDHHGKDHKKEHEHHKKGHHHDHHKKAHDSKKEHDRKKELSEQKKKENREKLDKIKRLQERESQKWNEKKKPSALSDKDRETLEKLKRLQTGTAGSLGKIPKKQTDSKISPPTYSSVLDKSKPSHSGEKKRTIKAPRDKFRDTGLLDEINSGSSKNSKKAESKPEVKHTPLKPFGSTTFPQKRSPPQDKEYAEKKLKLGLYGDTGMPYANATTNNAISPPINNSPGDKNSKSKAHSLQESCGFMAALDAAAAADNRRTKPKKKRTNSNEKKEEALTPTQIKPTFSFYKDRLEEDAEEKPTEEKQIKKEEEAKNPEVKTEEDVEIADVEESKVKPEEKQEDDGLEVLVMPKEDDDSDDSPKQEEVQGSPKQPTISGPKGVLVLHRVKKVKKRVSWVEESDLKQIHYFELDETERVNVNKMKTFGDMSLQEKHHEKMAFMKARKLVRDDLMEEAIMWYFPARIDGITEEVPRGSKSEEKNIQYAREKVVPPAHYSPFFQPDTPADPDHEMVRLQDIKIIPGEDLTNPNSVNDFRGTPWPEPKIYVPPVEPYKPHFRGGNMGSNDSGGGQWRCHDGSTFQGVVDNNVPAPNSMMTPQSGILGAAPPGFGPPGGGPPPPPPPQTMPPGFPPGGMGMPMQNPGMDMRGGPFHMGGGMPPFQRGRGGGGPQHHRGGGNRNDKYDRNRGGPPPPGGNKAVCEHYVRTGDCKFGKNCRFWHPPR